LIFLYKNTKNKPISVLLDIQEGSKGDKFNFNFIVYGNATDPHNNKVTKTKDKHGRTIHWVAKVQKS